MKELVVLRLNILPKRITIKKTKKSTKVQKNASQNVKSTYKITKLIQSK